MTYCPFSGGWMQEPLRAAYSVFLMSHLLSVDLVGRKRCNPLVLLVVYENS